MQKTIDLVLDWRSTFGLLVDGGGSGAEIELSKDLIFEELLELEEAIYKEDKVEQLDAIGDLAFVVVQLESMYRKPTYKHINKEEEESYKNVRYSISLMVRFIKGESSLFSRIIDALSELSQEYGVELINLVQEIYNSNMSKLCKDEQTAQETVQKYKDQGIETYYKVCPTDSSKYVVYRSSDNKVLKSVDFVEPDIQKLLK